MGEPSSSSAAEHPESDRLAPLMELIQLYRIEHALLLKHQEEVERRRAAVRAAAVQEASEILLSARQEIRRVLVQTRRELVQLSAQLRAVGYETTLGRSSGGDDFQVSVARAVPVLLLGLFVGVWVDRFPRRPLLIAADLGRAALLSAERRVGEDNVHPLADAQVGELETQAVLVVDLRILQSVQQQVHLAQQVRQGLGLAAE